MNILIIDDHPLVKEGVIARIKKALPTATCCFASNARMAISTINATEISLVFCDLEFNNEPNLDGFYIIKSILDFEPRIKAIALTNYNSYRIMKKAINSGFHSFLEKGCSFEEFQETLFQVMEQGKYESETMKKLFKKRNAFLGAIFSDSLYGISDLSPREKELTLLSATTTDRQQLAKIMNVTPYTIDSYFKSILLKLSLKSRKELALFSLEFKDVLLK